ncbi:MAG: hypothetical protein IPM24_28125 [Bryobacterales bacterium]|jgi:hypothetical protein|nr:hypothetical protein [Bryobacterales bacterium]
MIPVHIGVEDLLSEAVVRRLLLECSGHYAVGEVFNRGGFGYLRKTVRGWNRAAAGVPFVLLTDLDSKYPCPLALIQDWLQEPQSPNLLFRIAVQEVESWLLADRTNLAAFLRVSPKLLPDDPEAIADPKAALIQIAAKSRQRDLRDGIVPRKNSTAIIGPDYNGVLSKFVAAHWDPGAASRRATSLKRALESLKTFTPQWPKADGAV